MITKIQSPKGASFLSVFISDVNLIIIFSLLIVVVVVVVVSVVVFIFAISFVVVFRCAVASL